MKIFLLLFCLLIFSGCNKPLLTPEDTDPIYRDLMNEASNAAKAHEEQLKKVDEAFLKLKEIVPQHGQTKKFYNEYFMAKKEAERLRQLSEYFAITAKTRKYEARAQYTEAFKKGERWPAEDSYSKYELMKQAKHIDRDWRRRMAAIQKEREEQKKAQSKPHEAPSH